MPRTTPEPEPLSHVARPVTIIKAPRLSARLGLDIIIASETFQLTGSFKFRAAYNLAAKVKEKMLITASSGNFGQALSYACALLGKECLVVMPDNSASVKIEAVREFGGTVFLVDTRLKSRAQATAELSEQHPQAYVASAYDDPLVIEGNASLGRELAAMTPAPEVIVSPIGGGGLSSGIISGLTSAGCLNRPHVTGAEPAIANDAARSLKAQVIVENESEPQTIADGARTLSLGKNNWQILKEGLAGIVEVPEHHIEGAVRLLFNLANLKAEPTGALSLGAVLTSPGLFAGRRICCVVSGGNVDLKLLKRILLPDG